MPKSRIFNLANLFFNAIRENRILEKKSNLQYSLSEQYDR